MERRKKMKAIQVEYNGTLTSIEIKEDTQPETWPTVCRKFNDDVHRICDVENQQEYTALYECFDDQDKAVYYLVCEDKHLYTLKRKHFLKNIGKEINKVSPDLNHY